MHVLVDFEFLVANRDARAHWPLCSCCFDVCCVHDCLYFWVIRQLRINRVHLAILSVAVQRCLCTRSAPLTLDNALSSETCALRIPLVRVRARCAPRPGCTTLSSRSSRCTTPRRGNDEGAQLTAGRSRGCATRRGTVREAKLVTQGPNGRARGRQGGSSTALKLHQGGRAGGYEHPRRGMYTPCEGMYTALPGMHRLPKYVRNSNCDEFRSSF